MTLHGGCDEEGGGVGEAGDGHDLDLPDSVEAGQVAHNLPHLLHPTPKVAPTGGEIFPGKIFRVLM